MGTGLSTYRIKGTGRGVLAGDAVLRPESDGEQCSVLGRPPDWNVLPRVSLKPLWFECVWNEVMTSQGFTRSLYSL